MSENIGDPEIIAIARDQFEVCNGFTEAVRVRLECIIWATRTNPLIDLGFDTEVFALGGYARVEELHTPLEVDEDDVTDFEAGVPINYQAEFSGK